MTRRQTRRAFLAVAAAAVVGGAGAVLRRSPDEAIEPGEQLRRYLTDLEGAARLGALVPAGVFPAGALVALAPAGEDATRWFTSVDVPELSSHVRESTAADFAAGRLVEVDGWHLSRTEAALCVLAAEVT